MKQFAFALLAMSIPCTAQADALQQQVLAVAKSVAPGDFALTQTVRSERTGTPVREDAHRYDPRRGGWVALRIDGKPPTAKQAAAAPRAMTKLKVPSYARIAEWFSGPATRIGTTPTSATYRFASLPAGAVKVGSYDASSHTSVDAVVNTAGKVPFVERARFTSTKPFRMMMVVKVERFAFTATYRLLPDGRPVNDGNSGEFSGSFMGSAQTMRTRTTYSDYAAVR